MARPTKYTPFKADKIVEGLKAGMTRTAAAALVNVDGDSLTRWVKRYGNFAERVIEAENEAEARYTGVIAKAAFGHEVSTTTVTRKRDKATGQTITEEKTETHREYDWRAALEWLKRRRRKDWGDHVSVEIDREIEELLSSLHEQRLESNDESQPTLH